ncbi:MAG: STAS/SEC14 domain-containing protein [Verrucomicrobiia bacterium]
MIEYIIDRPDRLVRVRVSGCVTSADLVSHFSTVHDDPSYDPSFNILFQIDDDAEGPILAELPGVGLQMEAVARLQHGTKWAVVMAPGFKRTVIEFLLRGVKLAPVQMRFFDDNRLALAWLGPGHAARVPENA